MSNFRSNARKFICNFPQPADTVQSFAWRLYQLGLLGVFIITVGCGEAANVPVEPGLARETLTKTLQHWKGGGSSQECQTWTPPVVVGASQWSDNAKLLDFKIVDERPLDSNLFVNVELTLEVAGRRETTIEQYCVGTEPVLTVFRALSPAY